MLPITGLRWSSQAIRGGRRRIDLFSSRSFSAAVASSSSPRSILQLPTNGAMSLRTLSRPRILLVSSVLRNGTAMRFQSTKPLSSNLPTVQNTQVPPASTTPSELAGSAAQPPLDTSFETAIDLSNSSLLDMPEQIGYLKALGLDYGYGPTSIMQWILEHIHIYCDTPWWASIALTALFVRLIFLKLMHGASDNAARMASVQHLTKPLTTKMSKAQLDGDQTLSFTIRRELQAINKKAGIKLWRSFAPLVQIFTGIGTFILLRGMAGIPVPAFESGGALWFMNLAIPDPFFILPIITAGIMHVLFRQGGEMGVNTMTPGMKLAFSYGLPLMSLILTSFLPAALQFSFFVTMILSATQSTLFRNPSFRSATGMFPLPSGANSLATTSANPFQDRIITVPKVSASPPASSPTYEPPRRSTTFDNLTPPDAKETLLGGLKKEVSTAVKSVGEIQGKMLKTAREYVSPERKDGKRTKAEVRKAEEYERKRQAEVKVSRRAAERARIREKYAKMK